MLASLTNHGWSAVSEHVREEWPIRIGLVTPLANERANIEQFMDEVLRYLQVSDRWYCILDNVSHDGTNEVVKAKSENDARVVHVWAPQNRCVADAYIAGYKAAFASGCRWILEMDGGLSHPPAKIPEFIAAMDAGYDFAGGSRFMPGGEHRSPWVRRGLSYGGTVLAQLLLRSRMTDMTSGFECFSRRAMEYILKRGVQSRANFFQTEIRHMMHQFRWIEIPFVYVNESASLGRPAIGESLKLLIRMSLQK